MKGYVLWMAARVNVTINDDFLEMQVRNNDVVGYTRRGLNGGDKSKDTVGLPEEGRRPQGAE